MDLVFIQREALANSLLSNLLLAIEAKKGGAQVGVIFTGEALAAMNGGVFLWPRQLTGEARLRIGENAANLGIPLMGRGEGKQVNAAQVIVQAREVGVLLYACPVWAKLLGLSGKLPEKVTELGYAEALKMMQEAKSVIGSY